jgi:hypothetical protein
MTNFDDLKNLNSKNVGNDVQILRKIFNEFWEQKVQSIKLIFSTFSKVLLFEKILN